MWATWIVHCILWYVSITKMQVQCHKSFESCKAWKKCKRVVHSAGWTRAPFFVEKGRKERKEWRKEHGDLFKCQRRLVLKCLILAKEGGSAFFAAYQSGIDTAPHTDTSFMCVRLLCFWPPASRPYSVGQSKASGIRCAKQVLGKHDTHTHATCEDTGV